MTRNINKQTSKIKKYNYWDEKFKETVKSQIIHDWIKNQWSRSHSPTQRNRQKNMEER